MISNILRRNILFLIFLCFSISTFSQKFGVMGGFNYAKFIGKETLRYVRPVYRYNSGIYAEFEYSTYSTFLVEVKYDLRGTRMSDTIQHFINGYYTIKEKLDYITVPILYKLKLADNKFEIYFEIGASASYLIKKQRKMDAFDDNMPLNADYLFPFVNKRLMYDFNLAWGMTFKRYSLELKYTNGITQQYNDKSPLLMRNNTFSLNTYFTIYKVKHKRQLW